MAGILTITFSGVGVLDETFDFNGSNVLTYKNTTNTNKGYVGIKTNTASQVKAWYDAFELRFNRTNDYETSYDGTTITLEHPTNTHFDSFADSASNMSGVITTTTERSTITATTTFVENASNKCNEVACNIVFNMDVDTILIEQTGSGTSTTILDDDSFSNDEANVVLSREKIAMAITVTKNSFTHKFNVITPGILEIEDLIVSETAWGGTVTAEINSFVGSTSTEYAVNDADDGTISADYQNSNIFTGLTPGTKYLYARDTYGCVRTRQFTISDNVITFNNVDEDEAMSTRNSVWAAVRTIPTSQLVANTFNFLHHEAPHPYNNITWKHVYAESQNITNRFRSGFKAHEVKLIDCAGVVSEVTLEPTKLTDNIDRNTYLEGNVTWNSDYERLAVSFLPGDVYDENGNVTGTHTYNNKLPLFYENGVYLKINNEQMQIIDIITVSNVEYAITSSETNNPETGVIIESLHLAFPYEEYQFDLNSVNIPSSDFYYEIDYNRTNGDTLRTRKSNPIQIIDDETFKNGKWHVLRYYSDSEDSEVNFIQEASATVIGDSFFKFIKNIKFMKPLTPVPTAEVEGEILDNRYTKINYQSTKVYKTNFDTMPLEEAYRVADIFDNSDYVELDGMLVTSISPSEIQEQGQWGIPSVNIAVIGFTNEKGLIASTLPSSGVTGGYPVVT